MKKYLFFALALLGMASCAKDDLSGGNKPHHNGEVEESYIAINLMAADVDSRAAEDTYGYDQGTADERVVNTAYFFFFDAEGNPFYVNKANGPATEPGTTSQTNHLALSISENDDPASKLPNVSDIKKAVLVLETYKGVYPSLIVAVINWVPTAQAYTLDALHTALVDLNGTNGFVMSNSVYMDGANKMVDATPLTAANIKTSAEDAKDAPVEIYVERVAAKVVLTASGKVAGTTNIFDTQKNTTPVVSAGESSDIDVFVKLHGWELYNDNKQSYLLKDINPAWDVTALGLTWNDIPYYRSYWADTQSRTESDTFSWSYATGTYPTEYGFKVADPLSKDGDAYTYTEGTYTYCGENTGVSTIDGEGKVTPYANNTKVILKGQLMKADDKAEGGYSPLELARWYGTEYAGEEALRIAVANSLKYTLFSSSDGKNFDPIKPADLMCVDGGKVGADAYEVGFQLSTADDGFGEDKTWYKYDSTEGYVLFGVADDHDSNTTATNNDLKSVQPALLYKTGQTYYIVDIEHLGTKTAKYGVVRNHVYQIDINKITGYGSPVYNGTGNIIDPEYPEVEDESSYVAARINVLSWKVVKQTVDIVQ